MMDAINLTTAAADPSSAAVPSTHSRWLLESASDIYDTVEFQTGALYNEPAPEPWVSFVVGAVFYVVAFFLWIRRVRKLQGFVGREKLSSSVKLSCCITAYIDNDDPFYTIAKMTSQSFIFLGGLQMNYTLAFTVMLGFFTFESFIDSVRILLDVYRSEDLDDLVAASREVRTALREHSLTVLEPSNVYEDLTRGSLIVSMVFITQVLLISFVVITVYDTKTISCFDGSSGCPVTGTFGSWMLYVLGIFMACVYLLGPNTNFGMSEQNPAYWIQLLLSAKKSENKCTWYDPVKGKTRSRVLRKGDWKVWARFLMSFIVNGIGFHILVHALPIQVAGQSSLFSVVFRAVGMMYLVDLDDTTGYKMTLVGKDEDAGKKDEDTSEKDKISTTQSNTFDEEAAGSSSADVSSSTGANDDLDEGELSTMAQRIIDEAQAKLNALSPRAATKNGYNRANAFAAGPQNEDNDRGGDVENGGAN